jgi:hypothetical protein
MPQYMGVVPWEILGGHAPSNESMHLLLREFNKTEIITLASQLNLLASSFHSEANQVEILNMLVSDSLIDRQSHDRLVKRIRKTGGSELAITRPGMLELIRAAAIYCSDEQQLPKIKNNPHLGQKLARSFLHAHDLHDKREIVPFLGQGKADGSAAERELFNRTMAFTMRASHCRKSPRTPLLSLGRGSMLMKDELFCSSADHVERFEDSSDGWPKTMRFAGQIDAICRPKTMRICT